MTDSAGEPDRSEELFHTVVNLPQAEREAFLARIDTENSELGSAIRRLLAAHERSFPFIDGPTITVHDNPVSDIADEPEVVLEPGSYLGTHRIIRRIGAGAMGRVYLADDTKMARPVAIKVLPPQVSSDPERIRRFKREARIISGLNHPYIITIFEVGEFEGKNYLVTELVEGSTLRQLSGRRPMDPAKVVKIISQIAEALRAAHKAGVVHRDIKPENIMLRDDDYVKVLDFGLAKIEPQSVTRILPEDSTYSTQHSLPGRIMGTPNYMSPEQAHGRPVDARSDIFSLGVVAYELLSGKLPFRGSNIVEIREAFMNDTLVPIGQLRPELPGLLNHVVTRMLEKEPARRYQKATELLTDLGTVKEKLASDNNTRSFPPKPEPGPVPVPPPSFIQRLTLYLSLALVTSIVVAVIWLALSSRPAAISIAVLPLENRTGDASLDALSEGLTVGLIGSLAQIKGMDKVISHASVRDYKKGNKDAGTITTDLRVGALVISNIVRKDGHIVWSVELVDPKGRRIWGNQLERASEKANFSELPGKVAFDIARALGIGVGSEIAGQGRSKPTESAEAFNECNWGRSLMDRRRGDEQGLVAAATHFENAINLDKSYSQAYAGLSMAYSKLGIAFRSPSEMFSLARQMAIKARDLNEALPDAHVALATVAYRYDWNWDETEKEIRIALDQDPSSVEAHSLYCYLLWTLDRPKDALEHALKAVSIDPGSLGPRATLGTAYIMLRSFAKAEKEYTTLLENEPKYVASYRAFSYIHEHQGQYDKAVEELNTALGFAREDPTVLSAMGRLLALQKKPDEARGIIARMREIETRKHVSPILFAEVYAELGDFDTAMAELDKAVGEHSAYMPLIADRLTLKALRGDPRFIALLKRLKIPS